MEVFCILGPLFFIVYVNDVMSSLKKSKYLLYADHTVVYQTRNLHQATLTLQEDVLDFKMWFNRNQLTMNVKKN